ncbi:Bacterial regulatory protein, arsR family [Pyrobaculum oguniense TE7]|uniref:Bacterial regulatory protein, arsR family n=1 Tax=Pyrobaculum oguniense (strain DSM 13380 / JCM 10595 / TE7) TaxID=698757 RepID=H6QAP5_PYROT|nr:Bacterial regulatory protein, arsR family [Pyrobaculum oguniense TE7]
MESEAVRRRIVEYLRGAGEASVYQVAKALGISYGAAQWHLYVLEREGVVVSVARGRRRVVMLRDSFDAYLHGLKMADFFKELWGFLRSRGVSPDSAFLEAVRMLEGEGRELAEAFVSIAKFLYSQRGGGRGASSL